MGLVPSCKYQSNLEMPCEIIFLKQKGDIVSPLSVLEFIRLLPGDVIVAWSIFGTSRFSLHFTFRYFIFNQWVRILQSCMSFRPCIPAVISLKTLAAVVKLGIDKTSWMCLVYSRLPNAEKKNGWSDGRRGRFRC